MTQTKRKLGKEILSFILVLSMVVSGLPLTAFAGTEEEGLSKSHTEHTPECGYVEAVEGQPCTHEHTDECYSIVKCVHEHDESCGYAEATEGTPCNHVHDEVCGYIEAVEEVLCDCTDTDENGEMIHTEGCGYVEAVEGSPCTHIHDDICGYAEAVEGTPCNHICSIEDGCYELVCSHAVEGQHDDTCGYVEAVEGSPCKYEYGEDYGEEEDSSEEVTESTTKEESTETVNPAYTAEDVKAMIDALPDVSELESMSKDELNSIYEQAQEVYDAFETLTDEEQAELIEELERLTAIMVWFDDQTAETAISASYGGFSIVFDGKIWSGSGASDWENLFDCKITNISLELNENVLTVSWKIEYTLQVSNTTWRSLQFTYTIDDYSCDKDIDITLNNYKDTGNYRWCNFTITRSAGHNYPNGICVCGDYQRAEKNSDGYYEISNAGQLLWFAQQVNSGNTGVQGKLTADIDLNGIAYTPIGTESQPYIGIFDGNGKTISNLSIAATSSFQGLFGAISSGTVRNFTLRGTIDITATVNNIGGVAGYAQGGAAIDNVTSYVTITDSRTGVNATSSGNRINHVGGIVASLENSSIQNSAYNGTLTLQIASSVGGIIGIASGSDAKISCCTNNGNVTSNGSSAHVGGITGDATTGTYVGYCLNYSNVTSGGEDCLGGIIGYANENTQIEYCGNIGDVECTYSAGGYIGGILGYINNNSFASLKNCFNYGKITSKSGDKNHPGALIGWCRNSNVSMIANNYYLNSDVSASSGTAINNAYAMTTD